MTLTDLFLAELDREAVRTRRALEHVPLGHDDWKPHAKSMPLGRLAIPALAVRLTDFGRERRWTAKASVASA